mgnify:FL=1
MRFREATAADAAEILRLYKSLLTQEGVTWNEEYPDETCIRDDLAEHGLFVLEEDGRIAAAVSAVRDEEMEGNAVWDAALQPAVMIERVGVDRAFQGRGLARKAIAMVLEEMKARGYRGARYLVGPNNLRARAAYRPLHFRLAGETDAYGEHWLCYEKAL